MTSLPGSLLDRLEAGFEAARDPARAAAMTADYLRAHIAVPGPATDTTRLFGYCTAQAGHRDFVVRKAIGWALRHYARTDPDAVRHYLADHGDRLSPRSVREASKHL